MSRILVIEDEPALTFLFTEVFRDEGFEVAAAADGRQGFDLLEQHGRFDLVLVDLCMPGMDGRTIIRRMRERPELQDIPVVVVSGVVPSPDLMPEEGSYQAFFGKPFELDEIVACVQNLSRRAA